MILNRVWEASYGPETVFDLRPFGTTLAEAFGQAPAVVKQMVGVFGYLDTRMPTAAYVTWGVAIIAAASLAYLVASTRQRWGLTIAFAASLTTPAILLAAFARHTGFGVQGRHVLPLAVTVPLLIGSILGSRSALLARLRPRYFVSLIAIVVGGVQWVAW